MTKPNPIKVSRSRILGGSLADYCIIGGLVTAFGAGAFYVFGLTFQDTVNGTMSSFNGNNVAVSAGNGGSTSMSDIYTGDIVNDPSDPNNSGNPNSNGPNGGNTGSDSSSNGGGLTGGGSGQGATGQGATGSSFTGANNWFGDSNNNETAGSNGVSVGNGGTGNAGNNGGGFNSFGDPSFNPNSVAGPRSPQATGGSSSGGSASGGSSQGSTIASNENTLGTANQNSTNTQNGNADSDFYTGGGYYDPNYNPYNSFSYGDNYLNQIYANGLPSHAFLGSPGYPGIPGYPYQAQPVEAVRQSDYRPSFW